MEERPSEGNMLTSWQPGSKEDKEHAVLADSSFFPLYSTQAPSFSDGASQSSQRVPSQTLKIVLY
jgi:hypothetical protein